ncbi:NUDIX hydrolase [Corynebacterium pacaense]|uniref:NUDIX hydrolase n=1 Tax=Corynebacterium pacaense TaxID=1816684 RepID=UPI0009B95061|nr:NUDIX hydrolase [Corynebacterium pacaense]
MSDLKPEGSTSGAPKRRRRRRSRRSSGQKQNPESRAQNSTADVPGESPKTAQGPDSAPTRTDGGSPGPDRRKRSRRRGGNAATRQQTPNPEKKGEGGQRRRRKANPRRVHQSGQQSHMETSNETSAGGLVVSGLAESVSADGQVDLSKVYVALIGRLDRRGRLLWSMPKGHVEPGEDKATTAEREVWEETGIHGDVFADLGVIDYWFVSEGKRIHKTVHHHLLRYVDGDLNDEDPEVTEVSWIPAHQLIEHLAFADERKLARRAHDLLPELARREKAEGRATPR